MPFGFYWDPTYYLVVIGAVICMIASARVKTVFNKYNKVRSYSGMTGAEAAERVLRASGVYDVKIARCSGSLTDHYDPRSKTVFLSDSVYNSSSVAAVGVAAHDCGHAAQDAESYIPLRVRHALVPIANLGSMLAWPFILIGLLFTRNSSDLWITAGILLFTGAVAFQLVTLPVEFNASRRALRVLHSNSILTEDELQGTRKVLKAAALTYVASAAAIILQLLRILLLTGGKRRD